MAKKRRKPKMEFRYYQMPAGSPILALLGQKWVQNYGNDVDYLHFHNYLEIGFCYEGDGVMAFGEAKMRFSGREFTVIPPIMLIRLTVIWVRSVNGSIFS